MQEQLPSRSPILGLAPRVVINGANLPIFENIASAIKKWQGITFQQAAGQRRKYNHRGDIIENHADQANAETEIERQQPRIPTDHFDDASL